MSQYRRVSRAVVILATLVVIPAVYSPLQWRALARQALTAGFYVSNVSFAIDLSQYFQTDPVYSPFLHTWSLGLEEQFYLL